MHRRPKQDKSFDGKVGHEIGMTAGVLRRVFAARIRGQAEDITPEQFAVLVRLSSGKGMTQNEIADDVLKDDATITRVLDSFEKKKLAVRQKAEYDRRVNVAFITPKGVELVERVFPLIAQIDKKLCDGLGADELETAVRVLRHLRANAMQR